MVVVLVALGIVQMAVVPAPLASATMSNSSAAALAAQISAQSAQVHRVDVAYQAALSTVASLQAKTAAAQASVVAGERQIAVSRNVLRAEAVTAFVQLGGGPSQFLDILNGSPSSYQIGQVYLEATAGRVQDGLTNYQQAEAVYKSERATLAAQLRSAQAAAASLASVDQSLRATLASESATLSQVQQQNVAQVVAAEAPPGAPAPQGLPTKSGLAALATAPPPVIHTSLGGDFSSLRQCESGGNYSSNTGNGYYGAYQFSSSTWSNLGFSGLPSTASPATQDAAAQQLQARSGWGQWPACATALGLT